MCRNDRDKKQREETKIQLKTNAIMCGKFEMKQAEREKWLGQQISAGGLAKSVTETVAAKEGKIKAACIEVANIVNDWRTDIVGGLDADGAIKRKKCFCQGKSCSVQSGEAGGVEGEPQVDQGV